MTDANTPGEPPNPDQTGGTAPGFIRLADIKAALRDKAKVAVLTFAVVMLIVVAATAFFPRSYTATASLVVNHVSSIAWGQSTTIPYLSDLVVSNGEQTIETYAALLQSDRTAERVILKLALQTTPEQLRKHLRVKPPTNTNILGIAVTWSSPQQAASIANTYAAEFIEFERELSIDRAREAVVALDGATRKAQAELSKAQSAEAAFETGRGLADSSAQTNSIIGQIATLDQRIGQLRAEAEGARAQLARLSSQGGTRTGLINSQYAVQPNPAHGQIAAELSQVQVHLDAARTQFSSEYPAVVNLRRQEAALQQRLASIPKNQVSERLYQRDPLHDRIAQDSTALTATISGDVAQLDALSGQREALNTQLHRLPDVASHLADVKRRVTGDESVYTALKGKYDQAVIASVLAPHDLSLIEPADRLHTTSQPNRILALVVGAFISLIAALVAALVAYVRDPWVAKVSDVERKIGVPAIAFLSAKRERTEHIAPLQDLIAALVLSADSPVRSMAFVGVEVADDVGWAVADAAAAAIALGISTLVVEFTTPPAGQTSVTYPTATQLLVESLSNQFASAPAINDVHVVSLPLVPQIVRAITSGTFAEALATVQPTYGIVLLEPLPLAVSSIALAVTARADAALIVISESTSAIAARRGAAQIHAVAPRKLLGAVFTSRSPNADRVGSAFDDGSTGGAQRLGRAGRLLKSRGVVGGTSARPG